MAKKIDVHVHVGEDLYRRYTPEMALERMDRNDIEFAVISPAPDYPTPYGIKSSAQQNDYIAAALQKYPDRFVRGLGVVNPRHGMAAVPEVDRIFGELGLSGLMFSNDKTGLTMDNPTMIAFFEHTRTRHWNLTGPITVRFSRGTRIRFTRPGSITVPYCPCWIPIWASCWISWTRTICGRTPW